MCIRDRLLDKLAKLDFDIYYITLYLSNEDEYVARLDRAGKAKVKYTKFEKQSSVNQQNEYLKLADEIKEKYKNIHVVNIDNCRELEDVQKELKELLDWKE